MPTELSPRQTINYKNRYIHACEHKRTSILCTRSQCDDVLVSSWPLIVGMSPLNPL